MSASKLSDLLPIDSSVAKPNAYQVFGLVGGGHDDAAINAAMKRVYAGLKQAKSSSDPEIWQQAAQLAESARRILEDPTRRRALDKSLSALGSATAGSDSPPHSASGEPAAAPQVAINHNDPLAGLLPPVDPLTGAQSGAQSASTAADHTTQGGATKKASAVLGVPPGVSSAASVLGTPSQKDTAPQTPPLGIPPTSMPASSPSASTPLVNPANTETKTAPTLDWSPPKTKKTKKRRKKNNGMYLFAFFVVVMLAAIIGLLQFLSSGNRIAITQTRGKGMVAPPMNRNDPSQPPPGRSSDGVLAGAPSSGVGESLRRPNRQSDSGRPAKGSGIGRSNPQDQPPMGNPPEMSNDPSMNGNDADQSTEMQDNPAPSPSPQPTPDSPT